MHAHGVRRVLAVVTSAYASYSGCRQYREEIAIALAHAGITDMQVDKVPPSMRRRDSFALTRKL